MKSLSVKIHCPFFQSFLEDYDNFIAFIADLDRRLASIVCQGFDDTSGIEAAFKVCGLYLIKTSDAHCT